MKFGIIAEDKSDAETLRAIVKNVRGERDSAGVHHIGCGGCGHLCRKGAKHLKNFQRLGVTHFIVCHDADGDHERARTVRDKVVREVVKRSGCEPTCIVVPVQELEAWIIADREAIASVIPSFELSEVGQPEQLASPKEWLENESRVKTVRPLYRHATHNPKVAKYLDVDKVAKKCPSFRPLLEFVRKDQ